MPNVRATAESKREPRERVARVRARRVAQAVGLTIAALLTPPLAPAHGASLYWDANGAGSGGANSATANGTWGASNFWSTSANGTVATTAWVAGSTAVFSAGTNVSGNSSVSVSGTQSAAGVVFEEGTVTLGGSGTIALGGATPSITIGASVTPRSATINTALSATERLAIGRGLNATATLTLAGANTMSGGLSVAGSVRVNAQASGAFGGATGGDVVVMGTNAGFSSTSGNPIVPASVNLDNDFALNPDDAAGFVTAFGAAGDATGANRLTFAGDITGDADVYITASLTGDGTGDVLAGSGSGMTIFAGSNGYTGRTIVNLAENGSFQLGSAAALPPGTALVFGRGQAAAAQSIGLLDLAGQDVSIASLATNLTGDTGAANGVAHGITNSSAGAGGGGGITITGAAATTFAGVIGATGNGSMNRFGFEGSNNLSLTLAAAHAGSLTLTGANTYTGTTTINGGTLVLSGNGTVGAGPVVNNATLTVHNNNALGNVSGAGATTIGDGTNPVTVSANHFRQGTLTVANGATAVVNPNSTETGVSIVTNLSIGAGSKLDLKDNKLITLVAAGTATEGVYDGLHGQVQSASNFGSWDGPGLTTSMQGALDGIATIGVATGEQIRGLGPTDTDTWAGQTINGASTLAMYTYAGDANLDGQVDAGDYGILDAFIQVAGATGYGNGDFNYDGFIDPADYGTIDNSIQFQGAPFPTSASSLASALGVTAVPEPGAAALLMTAAATALLRRRRKHI